jgi:hypothetical protein
MIRCKVKDSTADVTIKGTTTQLLRELLILNVAVMKDVKVETEGGKIYSHAEKVMLIAEKLSKVALDIERIEGEENT